MAPVLAQHRRPTIVVAFVLIIACGGPEPGRVTPGQPTSVESTPVRAEPDGCAHVVAAAIRPDPGGTFTIDATVVSGDTGWDKYADQWDVVDPDGEVLATRVLAHPHDAEQPFTRTLSVVEIPETVRTVTLRARDSVEGYCGTEFGLEVVR